MKNLLSLKFLFAFIVFCLVPTIGFCNIIFYDDCEDPPSSYSWQAQVSGSGNSISVNDQLSKNGTKSYKFVLTPTSNRAELALIQSGVSRFKYNEEYWVGYSIFIPKGTSFTSLSSFGQFHGRPDGPIGTCDNYRNPIWTITPDPKGGIIIPQKAQTEKCSLNTYSRSKWNTNPKFIKIGEWNDFVLNFKFSYTNGGFFKTWLNGELILNDTGINCYNDEIPPYFKIGIYATLDKEMIVFYDEVRVGDKDSTYEEIAPKSGIGLQAPKITISMDQ